MIRNKKGSDDFRTVVHVLLGTIFFIIIGVATMFFMTGQDIKAIFEAGAVEGDKIATRIIFSQNCLALDETITATWYDANDERRENKLVRLGIIDQVKWDNAKTGAVLPADNPGNIIGYCVGYTITDDYKYFLDLGPEGTITITGLSGDGSVCDPGTPIIRKKIYPVLIYDAGTYENGVLRMNLRFCYYNETVGHTDD